MPIVTRLCYVYSVYDMFRFTVNVSEFCADVIVLKSCFKKLRPTH